MKIVTVGKDARTDAIGSGCARSPGARIFVVTEYPNPGMRSYAEEVFRVPSVTDTSTIIDRVRKVEADLVIIGPEEPLEAGVVDAIESQTRARCFGPTKALARIESSKSWTRQLLDRHGIPGNPAHRVFPSVDGLAETLAQIGDYVVKPDGLTGGKGVKVKGDHFDSDAEAVEYASEIFKQDGGPVVFEERLDGEEFSLQTITDGQASVHCPLVQDHKRAFEEDAGPNTGGMGSYSDVDHSLPFLSHDDVAAAHAISERVIRALAAETGQRYRGVLYGGFIATADGVRLIEYNARFGDPEALNVLSILEGDLAQVCWDVSREQLDPSVVRFARKATVCKYVVPESYPRSKGEGDVMYVPDWIGTEDGIRTYWAAVEQRGDSEVAMTGSRAVAFVGIGDSIAEAEVLAERAAASVEGPVRHRRDIGTTPLVQRRIEHLGSLRGSS